MSIYRSCPAALQLALAARTRFPAKADLYKITLKNGTVYRWTGFDRDLTCSGYTYSSMKLKRGRWSLTNSMTVSGMDFTIFAANETFEDGGTIKAQASNGLFDGAEILHSRAYMSTPGTVDEDFVLDLNAWIFGELEIGPTTVKATLNAKVNRLNGQAPRNLYQAGCEHTFCDDGCTLSASGYTTSHTVGDDDDLSKTFIPWDSAPSDYSLYKSGTLYFSSGDATGEYANVQSVSSSGLTLAYPLYHLPAAGDSFTAFKGCQKTKSACTAYSNIQNWRAFPYTPQVEDGI